MEWLFGSVFAALSSVFFVLLIKGILADVYGIGSAPRIRVNSGSDPDDPQPSTIRERAYVAYPVLLVVAVIFGGIAWMAFTA